MIVGWIKRLGVWLGIIVAIASLAAIAAKIHIMENNMSNIVISDSAQNQMILNLGLHALNQQECPIESALARNYENLSEYIINHCNGGEIWKASE